MEFDTTPLFREIELLCRGWLVQQANLRVLVPRSLALYRQEPACFSSAYITVLFPRLWAEALTACRNSDLLELTSLTRNPSFSSE